MQHWFGRQLAVQTLPLHGSAAKRVIVSDEFVEDLSFSVDAVENLGGRFAGEVALEDAAQRRNDSHH
jgi:hypothetical protein